MKKTLTLIAFCAFFAIDFTQTATSAPRTFFKSCLYKETLDPNINSQTEWHLYNVQEIPRNRACPTPNAPVVYVNGHAETILVSYSHTSSGVSYYSGITNAGQECTVKINSFLIAD